MHLCHITTRNKANAIEKRRREGGETEKNGNSTDIGADDATTHIDNTGGLGTNLRPNGDYGSNYISRATKDVELFLCDLEKHLLDHIYEMKDAAQQTNEIERRINDVFNRLKRRPDLVVARTDKTNSIHIMETSKYIEKVEAHLKKDAAPSNIKKLEQILKDANAFLEQQEDLLSINEYNYIKSTISKKSVPTVQALIKDHKKKDENGDYPSRLVVPAKNLTAGFPHVGQHGLRNILDKNMVDYERKTIKQASDLKQDLEKLNIKRSNSTIVTVDIEAMYPSIQFIHVQKAVEYFLRDAPQEDKIKADRCLEMIKFGMANTIVTFAGKYYEYGGMDVETKGLTIGGYESAFLADLVAAYILENLEDMFQSNDMTAPTYARSTAMTGLKSIWAKRPRMK